MEREPEPTGVYVGPGLWEGRFIVPAVVVVALVSGLVVAWVSGDLVVAVLSFLGGVVVGLVAWVALWDLFARLHPRFSNGGTAEAAKYDVVMFGPPVIAGDAVAAIALAIG